MAWRPHGHANVDGNSPRAWAVCDSCGFTFNHYNLKFQQEWRGIALESTGFLKCRKCLDVPFIFNRPKRLPADPLPIQNARPLYVQYTAPALTWDSSPSGIAMPESSGRGYDDNLTEWL